VDRWQSFEWGSDCPHAEEIAQLCELFGVSADELVTGSEYQAA
jgi:hypothetical protein